MLLSAPGVAGYAGCLWWRALVDSAAAETPGLIAADILDCGDAPGWAMAALRAGCRALVLHPTCPGWPRVAAAAGALGAIVLPHPPVGLDLAEPGAARALLAWLDSPPAAADRDRTEPIV